MIIQYMTEHYVIIIIVLVLAVIAYTLYFSNNTENFTDPNLDSLINKMINLKTTYNGKQYFLASIPMSNCTNSVPPDCLKNTLVLLEQADMDKILPAYTNKLNQNIAQCNASCKDADCTYCAKHKRFINDFTIRSPFAVTGEQKKYKLISNAGTLANIDATSLAVGQYIQNNFSVCGDIDSSANINYTNIDLIETGSGKIKIQVNGMYLNACAGNTNCVFTGSNVTRVCLNQTTGLEFQPVLSQ